VGSFVYKSCLDGLTKGRINFSRDRFKTILVDGYVPDQDHRYRSEVDGEAIGTGYIQGGVPVQVNVDGPKVKFDGFTLAQSSIKATGAVIVKDGGSAMLDVLVCYVDFGQEIISKDGPFTLTDSSLRLES
jgi:hypothetical protein